MAGSRSVSSQVQRELNKQESAELYLIFLTLTHPSLPTPIRVVSDPENFMMTDGTGSALVQFQGFDFELGILSDGEQMPRATLSVQNIDRVIGQAVFAATDPVRVEIQIVAGSEFDLSVFPRTPFDLTIERMYRARHLYLTEVEGNVYTISGTLRSWDYTQETWPGIRATAPRFPGLYW